MFTKSKSKVEDKLKNFSKYVKRQHIARFMVHYEIFKRQLNVMGNIVECGVHQGGGIMNWAKISSIFEPYGYKRKIVGFDTFSGFPSVSKIDNSKIGKFAQDYNTFTELLSCIEEYDDNRFLNNIKKIELIKGDAIKTIPKYIKNNKHFLVSLLNLDFDVYKPTKVALEQFLPRMCKGSIIVFDELNAENWKGETTAMLESLNIKDFKIEKFSFEPNISFIQL